MSPFQQVRDLVGFLPTAILMMCHVPFLESA